MKKSVQLGTLPSCFYCDTKAWMAIKRDIDDMPIPHCRKCAKEKCNSEEFNKLEKIYGEARAKFPINSKQKVVH